MAALILQSSRSCYANLAILFFQATLDEALAEAEEDFGGGQKDGKLDFDEFVNLMLIFRKRDGFSKAEAKELDYTFKRFDDNGNDEVETLELCDMLRYLGHATQLDEVQLLAGQVDFNNSGSLDFREFLRLMRMHREEELSQCHEVWQKHYDEELAGIPSKMVPAALAELGYTTFTQAAPEAPTKSHKRGSITMVSWPTKGLDFEEFAVTVDTARTAKVAQQRRCAGFNDTELDRFRKLFATFDADRSGIIEAKEVGLLLDKLGFKLSSYEDRQKILEQVDQARMSAASVGVEDVGQPGSGHLSFWVLVQLLRVLFSRDDKRVLDRETRAVEQTRFVLAEVDSFREVFANWFARDKMFEDEAAANAPGAGNVPRSTDEEVKELSKDCMRRLCKSMGMKLNTEQRNKLERKIDDFGTTGRVDFADFLRLMRWMLDTNFADIQTAAGKAAH